MASIYSAPDEVRRFIVENRPVRGQWVRIESAWRALREHKQYPPAVRELLGQAVSASVLLAATLKFKGTLTFQIQGAGAVRLLVAQCTHDFRVRAVARVDDARLKADGFGVGAELTPEVFRELVGDDGRVAVTVEAIERGTQYQGVVPLVGDSLAECLETYFASSEQLPTRVRLAADDRHAGGLLVQKLPEPDGDEAESAEGTEVHAVWRDAQRSIGSVERGDLLQLPLEEVLARNFSQRDLRLFKGAPVRFECRCSQQRVAGLLRALGPDEVRDVLREQGEVIVTCDFCSRPYRFDAVDIEQLFAPGSLPGEPKSIH